MEGRITVYRKDQLGHADHGWLDARHHFSFAGYFDRKRMGFGALRVVNDDKVAAGTGFDPHPHNDMEIITYVRSGSIRHRDNLGNEGVTKAGDVQVMSAGKGIAHAEYADAHEPTTLYQIWINTRERGITPRWEQAEFPKDMAEDGLRLLASGRPEHDGKGALYIHQYASLYGGRLKAGAQFAMPLGRQSYLLVSKGEVDVNGQTLKAGDGAEVEGANALTFKVLTDAEVLVIDVAGAVAA